MFNKAFYAPNWIFQIEKILEILEKNFRGRLDSFCFGIVTAFSQKYIFFSFSDSTKNFQILQSKFCIMI